MRLKETESQVVCAPAARGTRSPLKAPESWQLCWIRARKKMLCTFPIVDSLKGFQSLITCIIFNCVSSAIQVPSLPTKGFRNTIKRVQWSRENNIWLHNSQCRCMWTTRVLIVFGMRRPPRLNTSKCSCINGNRSPSRRPWNFNYFYSRFLLRQVEIA